MVVSVFTNDYKRRVIDLILSIQRDELGVKITEDDQPDLKDISANYQKDHGNFWLVEENEQLVGTIALIDIGNNEVGLRKMFVAASHRGKEKGVAQALMNEVLKWCREKKISAIYLGTIDIMKAAHRFYEKNGFERLEKGSLPPNFLPMKVDNVFYKYTFTLHK
ncbi:MAG TPA: GNAT family N-acetyltransferase [Chitinophagaceae bacterium]|nr:GNAT family N-acetyltransferase [Chitinophagaceae bacterium]